MWIVPAGWFIFIFAHPHIRGIRIGKIDSDGWTGRDYVNWYKKHIDIAFDTNDVRLMNRATLSAVSYWYRHRVWREEENE
jgi:hypothetical protein